MNMNQDKPYIIKIRTIKARKISYTRKCNGAKLVPTILAVLDEWAGFEDKPSMKMKPANTIEEARQQAIDWQTWQAEQSLSLGELAEWQAHFERLAKQFDLTDEFKENGII